MIPSRIVLLCCTDDKLHLCRPSTYSGSFIAQRTGPTLLCKTEIKSPWSTFIHPFIPHHHHGYTLSLCKAHLRCPPFLLIYGSAVVGEEARWMVSPALQ